MEKTIRVNGADFVLVPASTLTLTDDFMRHTPKTNKKMLELLEEYKREHGDLLVPAKYCSTDGIKLGSIVSNIRTGARKTTAEEKAKLDELGFVWKVR